MKQKWFVMELILLATQAFSLLPGSNRAPSVAILCMMLLLSLKIHGGRPHTPIQILSILMYTLRVFYDIESWLFYSFQVFLLIATLATILMIRVFSIPHRHALYEMKYKQQTSLVGFSQKPFNNVPVSIWYPTKSPTDKDASWLISNQTYKQFYGIFYVDIAKKKYIPFWLFKFMLGYLSTYNLGVHSGSQIMTKNKYKVVLFSHGLGAHSRAYSSYTHWWAKRGYIVISVQHNKDDPCVDYRVEKSREKMIQWLYNKRNEQMIDRKQQLVRVFLHIQNGGLNELFGQKIEIEDIMLAGHSFGGASILQAGAQLINQPLYQKVSRYLCLDPWVYPLSTSSYTNLQRPILFINSERFVRINPDFYQLHAKNNKLLELNPQMSKICIRGLQHLHPTDTIFTFGTMFVLTGSVKNFGKRMMYVDILVYMICLFEEGKTGEEIVQLAQKQIKLKMPNADKYIKIDERKLWQD